MYATAPNPDTTNRHQTERTIARFERAGIAVFPARVRQKGRYVEGWPAMPVDEAIATTRRDFAGGAINLAGRTGSGVAVFDLDAKEGVDPDEMLQMLRHLVGPAIIAIVRTSRGYHIWLKVKSPVGNGFCSFLGGEVFSESHLAMLPPSVHPSGAAYAWELEPREPEAAADLRSLGLVPDGPAPRSVGRDSYLNPVDTELQEEFRRLTATAGVHNTTGRPQTLHRCPWHEDRSPSLSINWSAAVFYCFGSSCGLRGGVRELRRVLGIDTPTYRQRTRPDARKTAELEGDDLSGDKSGCLDVDAAVVRLAGMIAEAGDHERALAVSQCRQNYKVGKCTSCARTPAFPISCGHSLCPRCMPGRFRADWARHQGAMPAAFTTLRLEPRGLSFAAGVLRQARGRFRDWRKRSQIDAGIYGVRVEPRLGAVVLLAIPADQEIPSSSRAFDVVVVAERQAAGEVASWLQAEYLDEAVGWTLPEDLDLLMSETKGRRRFQGFGAVYGEQELDTSEGAEDMKKEEKRSLARVSGGSGSKKEPTEHKCTYCGGNVELYPFTVNAKEVQRFGNGWLWLGAKAGESANRPYTR